MDSSNTFQFQEIDRVNCLLPYSDQLDAYADAAWLGIKTTFSHLITTRTFITELPHVLKSLLGYIQLFGHRFSKEEHISLIKFLLSIGLCPNFDKNVSDLSLSVSCDLLQSCKWVLRPHDLSLDWRAFDNASVSLSLSLDLRSCEGEGKEYYRICKALRLAKRFFPISCVWEIWDDLRANIYYRARYGPHENIFSKLIAFTPIQNRTFDEISRVWLADIFLLWYRPSDDVQLNQEIINILGIIAARCPGRVDWEPHMDRIFSCLIKDLCIDPQDINGDLSKHQQRVTNGYARLLIYAIIPNSTVISRMQFAFKIFGTTYHPSVDHPAMLFFVTFCKKILANLYQRLRNELNRSPQTENLFGKTPVWNRLSVSQVDEVIQILLPICLDSSLYTRRSRCLTVVTSCLDFLSLIRPRAVLPRILDVLEAGFGLPELPMRVTRPLQALGVICPGITSLRLSLSWSPPDIGRQAADQCSHDLSSTGDTLPNSQLYSSAEDNEFIQSHISSLLYPNGRSEITRILRCCLSGLDVNDSDRLQACLGALSALFLTAPMQDFSETCLPDITDCEAKTNASFRLSGEFSSSRIALSSLEIEDLTVQVYTRILSCIQSINESMFLCIASTEGHDMEQGMTPKERETRILCGLTGLAVSLGVSAGPATLLRIRLIKLLTDVILANHWNPTIARMLNYQLIWLISGKRNITTAHDETGAEISDVALYAMREFWPGFMHLFNELNNENAFSRNGIAEPRFLGLLCLLPAYITALIPSHLSDKHLLTEFVEPMINMLACLMPVSLGKMSISSVPGITHPFSPTSSGPEPCYKLAVAAASAAGVLIHRLTAFSINFDKIDLLNTCPDLPPQQSPFINSPIWSPYVTWFELLRMTDPSSGESTDIISNKNTWERLSKNFWNCPSPESFAIAQFATKILLFPVLQQLSESISELREFLSDSNSGHPSLQVTSGLPFISQQRQFLSNLVIWMHFLNVGISESLIPRAVKPEDPAKLTQLMPQLEVFSDQSVCLDDSQFMAVDLNIPLFDVSISDGGPLRERIFQTCYSLLDTLTLLTEKFDAKVLDTECESSGESTSGRLITQISLELLMQVTCISGFNEISDEGGPFRVLLNTDLSHLCRNNLGASSCVISSNGAGENLLPAVLKLNGPSSSLLHFLSCGLAPSTNIPCFVTGHLPLAWLFSAQTRHRNFVALKLARSFIFTGHARLGFTQMCRLKPSSEILNLTETIARLSIFSNNNAVSRTSNITLAIWFAHRVPGALNLCIQRGLDVLDSAISATVSPGGENEEHQYRARKQTSQKVVMFLGRFLQDESKYNRLFQINPTLWADVWVHLAWAALFKDIAGRNHQNCIGQSQLSSADITHRYADQESLSTEISSLFEMFDQFPGRLHFPSFDPITHPKNSWFLSVIENASSLLATFCVPRQQAPDSTEPTLFVTNCRRQGYEKFVNEIYSKCLSNCEVSSSESEAPDAHLSANYGLISRLLSHWPIPCDPPINPPWEPGCQLNAPPPPPPPIGLVRMALGLIGSIRSEIAAAAIQFCNSFIQLYMLRFRVDDYIQFDTQKIAKEHCPVDADFSNPSHWPGMRDDNFGIIFDPDLDCLSNNDVFHAYHHIPSTIAGFAHYIPEGIWRNPSHEFSYPVFGSDGLLDLKFSEQWLRYRPEVDLSFVTNSQKLALQEAMIEIATHFTSPLKQTRDFWFNLSRNFLFFHRYADSILNSEMSEFVGNLCDSLGPDPLLKLLEEYSFSMLIPTAGLVDYGAETSMELGCEVNQTRLPIQTDGVVENIGPSLVGDVLMALALGALSWPRSARLNLHACVLPRVLMALEAAALLASTCPSTQSVDDDVPHALKNVSWCSVSLAIGNGGSAMDLPSADSAEVKEAYSQSELQVLASDQEMYNLLSHTDQNSDVTQIGGPRLRLQFSYTEFVREYLSHHHTYPQYLVFLWNFAKMMLDESSKSGKNSQSDLRSLPLLPAGEQMDESQTCIHVLYSGTSPLAYGECPICFACRLLPSPVQRRFIFYNLSFALLKSLRWNGIKLLNHIYPPLQNDFGNTERVPECGRPKILSWNELISSSSIWNREVSALISIFQSASLFGNVVLQQPPIVRIHTISGDICEHPMISFLKPSSINFSEAVQKIFQSLTAGCHAGQPFVLRRFLPLLVRDSIAVLLIRGVQPSQQSLALQDSILSQAIYPLIPAVNELAYCSPAVKWAGSMQLKSRLGSLFLCLPSVLSYAFPSNPVTDDISESNSSPSLTMGRCFVLHMLAPLLADLVSTSNLFWTGGKSEANKESAAAELDDLDMCLGLAINEFGRIVCAGHCNVVSVLSQTELLLKSIEVFLAHSSWKTRAFGLLTMRVMPLCNVSAFWTVTDDCEVNVRKHKLCQRIQEKVVFSLLDPWIEVSRAASEALSWLIQSNILEYDTAFINTLMLQSRTPLYRGEMMKSEPGLNALRSRHAGILGLCAFIRASVHDTPDHLPAIIAEVADHAHDPQPIQKTVSDTLMAYSRCHQERWRDERLKFTEAQLDVYLSVVSSVSYYV